MKRATDTERSKAFDEAATLLASGKLPAADVDNLKLGLIQLLVTENNEIQSLIAERNRSVRTAGATGQSPASQRSADETADEAAPSGTESEDLSEYYPELIGTVAALRDERAIPALLGAAPTGGMATRGVARFGRKALDAVLEQVKSQDSELASGAIFVLRDMLEFRTANDPDSRLRIKNALRSALASPDSGVRYSAVGAIEYLDDREEFVPTLKDLAEHDPDKLAGQLLFDGTIGDAYFVRQIAKRLLLSIANHEPPAVDKRGLQY